MEDRPEKRNSNRRHYRKSISYEKSSVEQGQLESFTNSAACVDISQGGLGFMTDRELKAQEVLKLLLPLEEAQITVPVIAEVMWSARIDKNFRAGLKFLL